jgi:hypothetical protein
MKSKETSEKKRNLRSLKMKYAYIIKKIFKNINNFYFYSQTGINNIEIKNENKVVSFSIEHDI